MRNICILLVAIVLIGSTSGCKTSQGAREFIPGRGWVPVR